MNFEEIASALESLTNSAYAGNLKKIAEKVTTWHPALQQDFFDRFIVPFIREMSEKLESDNFDGRNKLAVTISNKITREVFFYV